MRSVCACVDGGVRGRPVERGGRGGRWREREKGGGLESQSFLGVREGEVLSDHSLVPLDRGLASTFPLPSRGLAPADCSGEEDDDPDTTCCLGLVPHQVCVCVSVCLCFCE